MDVLTAVAAAKPRAVGWAPAQAVLDADNADIEANLENYNSEGYTSMTHDTTRNDCYENAIRCAALAGARRWVEVGAGADALLTGYVLRAHPSTTIVSIEGNLRAARAAARRVNRRRATILCGMSTDAAVRTAAQAAGPYDAVVQEVLGFFANSEGVARIVADLKRDLALDGGARPCTYVPTRAATFAAPVLLTQADLLRAAARHPFDVAADCFALLRRMPVDELHAATGGAWDAFGQALEYLDFRWPEAQLRNAAAMQTGSWVTSRPARVNGLACWIWCETAPQRAPAQGKGLPLPGYPYGADRRQELPPMAPTATAFSSLLRDNGATGLGWRNVFLPFATVVQVPAGGAVQFTCSVDLRELTPSYNITVSVRDAAGNTTATPYSKLLRNLYPDFQVHA